MPKNKLEVVAAHMSVCGECGDARISRPQMTEEQHDASWRFVSDLMGLE